MMQNFTINAPVCIYFLADLNFDHSVELSQLTLLEDELGRFIM